MNKRIRTRALLLLILLISRTVDAQKPAQGTTDDERLQFLIAAYDGNRNRFTEFSARFRVVKGSAESDEGAIAGRIDARVRMQGIWCVNGDQVRYELRCEDPRDNAIPKYRPEDRKAGAKSKKGNCDSIRILGDGALGVNYSTGLEAASFSASRGAKPQIFYSPFSMAVMGYNEEYGPTAPLLPEMSREADSIVGDVGATYDVIRVKRKHSTGDVSVREWWLDPNRGYLPVEMRYYENSALELRAVATRVRKVENAGFVPIRSVTVSMTGALRSVTEISVDEFVSGPPDSDDMQISLPAGTLLFDPEKRKKRFRLRDAEVVNVADLAEWYQRFDLPAPIRPQP